MPKKGEIGLALLLTMQHGHHLFFVKSRIMKRAMDYLSLLPKSKHIDKEDDREVFFK